MPEDVPGILSTFLCASTAGEMLQVKCTSDSGTSKLFSKILTAQGIAPAEMGRWMPLESYLLQGAVVISLCSTWDTATLT